jgi:hypothetical protein
MLRRGAANNITSSARCSRINGTDRPERLGGLQVDDRSVLGRSQHRCRLPLLKSFIRASLQDFFRSGMITLSTQADSASSTSPKTCASFRPVRAGT